MISHAQLFTDLCQRARPCGWHSCSLSLADKQNLREEMLWGGWVPSSPAPLQPQTRPQYLGCEIFLVNFHLTPCHCHSYPNL